MHLSYVMTRRLKVASMTALQQLYAVPCTGVVLMICRLFNNAVLDAKVTQHPIRSESK